MLVASQTDRDFASKDGVAAVQWGSDIRVGEQRTMAGAASAVAYTPRNAAMGKALNDAPYESLLVLDAVLGLTNLVQARDFNKAIPMTGLVLTFAHTLGEFGVVLMVGGNIPGVTRTVSVSIYDNVQALDFASASQTSLFLLLTSFVILAIVYATNRRATMIFPGRR